MPDPVTKRCSSCGEGKPLTEFSRASNARDGLQWSCKRCKIEYNHKYYDANHATLREQQRQYREADPEVHRERCRRWRAGLRQQVFGHYGTACACCGVTKNLTIDHINGDGARHRRELFGTNAGDTYPFYVWLVRQGFPPGYQTLCHTCNLSKGNSERCYLHRAELPGGTLIFQFYSVVAVKLGDERYVFDRDELRFKEVVEIEKATGLSFAEWQQELGRLSIMALGGLLHMLRKRAGVPSDFETMDFRAAEFDVVPLHEDGSEFTVEEMAADVAKRLEEAANPVPTIAAGEAASGDGQEPGTTKSTSRTSARNSTSGRGNSKSSRGGSSRSSKPAPTPS